VSVPILDANVAAFIGEEPSPLGATNPETGEPFICQNGVRPGPEKLAQFRLALTLRGAPARYAQEGLGEEAIVYVKLFDPTGSATWYLMEWDGQDEAFGYVTGLAQDEFGYVSLEELSQVSGGMGIGIEIDEWFIPTPIQTIQKKGQDL
jgi:hypothetical protein